MSLTDRDRRILMGIIPLVLILAYWFLLVSPKRAESAKVGEELVAAEQRRDDAQARATQVEQAKTSFAADYAELVRLGKAIPSSLDMPSLLVQLDRAAAGTDIEFVAVQAGERTTAPAPAPAAAAPGAAPGATPAATPAAGTPPASGAPAAGGAPAQSGPGQAAQSANSTAATANTAAGAPAAPAAAGAPGAPVSAAPGLDSQQLDFRFRGDFFDLADFFHQLKRFVRANDNQIVVRGRLMTIDSFAFKTDEEGDLTAEVKASVYLSPKSQGATAGASPAGPPAATTPAGAPAPASAPPTPTATATP